MRIYFSPGPVPTGDYRIPVGTADIKRTGSDLSILTYGRMVTEALSAAEELAAEGIETEVVDLRCLVPIDRETVLESVSRTGRAIVAHAAVEFCGFGAELAAVLHQELHGQLKSPVARVGGAYTPVPFVQSLESEHFSNAGQIVSAAKTLLAD